MRDYWSLELIFSCKYVGQQVPMYVCPWAVCLCVWIYLSTSFYNIQNVQSECIQIHNVQESIQIHNVQESIQNFPECSRMHADHSRMFQYAWRMFENVPTCIQIHELVCSYIRLLSVNESACSSFLCLGSSQEFWCYCMQLHELAWKSMSNELACNSLSLHSVPWAFMNFYELTLSSMS